MQHVEPDQLALLALGERMDPRDEDELTAHLAGCPVCQREVRALRATVDLARETVGYRDETISPPAGVWDGIVAELGLDASSQPEPRSEQSRPPGASVDRRADPTGASGADQPGGPDATSDFPLQGEAGGAGPSGYAGPGSYGEAGGAGPSGYAGQGSYGEAGGAGPSRYAGPGSYGEAGGAGPGPHSPAVRGRPGGSDGPGTSPVGGLADRRDARRRQSRPWARRAVALAAAATVGVLGTVIAIRPWTDDAPVVQAGSTALLDPVAGGPANVNGQATVIQTPTGPELRITTAGLPLQTGFYQVWVFDGKTRMQAVGVLGKDRTATLPLPETLDLRTFNVVDISLEPYDGDQTHSATSVLRGTLTS